MNKIILLLFCFLCACKDEDKKLISQFIEEPKCIIAFSPDEKEREEMELAKITKDFSEALEDNEHYQQQALELLKKKPVKILQYTQHVFTFKKKNGELITLDRDDKGLKWGFIFFDYNKNPQFTDIMIKEKDYQDYFEQ